MTEQQQKEQFSRAFVLAVAAVAHFQCGTPAEPDDDSIDLTFRSVGPRGTYRSPKLDVQLKCTSRTPEEGLLALPLQRKNYDDLRHLDFQVPRLLVVVQVPSELRDGLDVHPDQMVLRHRAWWLSLRGQAETSNTATVTVYVPGTQPFTPDALRSLMDKIGRGEAP